MRLTAKLYILFVLEYALIVTLSKTAREQEESILTTNSRVSPDLITVDKVSKLKFPVFGGTIVELALLPLK